MRQHHFSLSLLSLALISSFTHAQNTDETQLPTVKVQAARHVSTKPLENLRGYEQSNATDMKDVFADHPSIQFSGGNGTAQRITIRGLAEDQVAYVVDNASTDAGYVFHHEGRFTLDPAMVKITKVEKGAGSASAGIGASGARIVAQTLDAEDLLRDGKNLGARIRAGVGSNSGYFGGMALYGQTQDRFADALFQGNWVHENDYKGGRGFKGQDGSSKVHHSALSSRSYLAKLNIRPNEDWKLSLKQSREESYGERNLKEEFYTGLETGEYYKHRTTDQTNLAVQGQNAGIFDSIDANVYRIQSEHALYRNPTITPNNETYGANLNLSSKIGERHLLKYGANYRQAESLYDKNYAFKQNKEDYKAYIEGIWSLGEDQQYTLTTGLSYDYFNFHSTGEHSVSDGRFNPSLGFIWDASDALSFSFSHHHATRSPRFLEAQMMKNIKPIDPNTKAERSQITELGFTWRKNNLSLDGSIFHQKIKDLTNHNAKAGGIFSQGSLKNTGYEFSAAYQFHRLKARLGVAESRPKINGTTADDVQTAIALGRHWTASLAYTFEQPQIEIGWRGRFAESSSYTKANGNTVTRHGYGVHDLYANWQPKGKDHFNVHLSIDNVLNKNYIAQSQRAGAQPIPEAGRDVRLGLTYRW